MHYTEIWLRLNHAVSFNLKNDSPQDGASQLSLYKLTINAVLQVSGNALVNDNPRIAVGFYPTLRRKFIQQGVMRFQENEIDLIGFE